MNKTKRDWHLMALNTHRNADGLCEWCGSYAELGTPPAHLIPRNTNDKTLDEDWNLALLSYIEGEFWDGEKLVKTGCTCHTRLDIHRGKAYQAMRAEKYGSRLLARIETHPRLKEYFDRRLAIWEVKREQAERNRDA